MALFPWSPAKESWTTGDKLQRNCHSCRESVCLLLYGPFRTRHLLLLCFVVFKVGFTTPSVEPNWGLELTTLGLRPEWRSRLEYWTWTHWATQDPPKWDIWTTCQKNRSDCPLPAPTPAEDASSLASRHLLTDHTWDLDTGFISCSNH